MQYYGYMVIADILKGESDIIEDRTLTSMFRVL